MDRQVGLNKQKLEELEKRIVGLETKSTKKSKK